MSEVNIFIELIKTDNQTYFSAQTLSTNALVNINQILSSAPVTTAAGVMAVAWDLSRTANLTSTIALTGTTISTNLSANISTMLGSPIITTAAGVAAVAWDLGRTANATSTLALTGLSISTNILVDARRIFASPIVTTGAGILSAGITGAQTFDITGSLSGTVGSVVGAVGSVTGAVGSVVGLNPALVDVSVSSRLAKVDYLAPLTAAGTRAAVGLAAADLDTQLALIAVSTAAIQGQTDQLTFTTTGQVDANVKSVNDTTVTGSGTAGAPWGP